MPRDGPLGSRCDPRDSLWRQLRQTYGAADFVAVHVRLGDRVLIANWLAPTPEYIARGTALFAKTLPSPVFLLFTGVAGGAPGPGLSVA